MYIYELYWMIAVGCYRTGREGKGQDRKRQDSTTQSYGERLNVQGVYHSLNGEKVMGTTSRREIMAFHGEVGGGRWVADVLARITERGHTTVATMSGIKARSPDRVARAMYDMSIVLGRKKGSLGRKDFTLLHI
jgi:hypothetical protein